MKEEIQELQERKKKLIEAIELAKQKKKQAVETVQKLASNLGSRLITRYQYEEELKKALKNRTAEQWIKYYDDYINYYYYQIKLCDRLIKQERFSKIKKMPKKFVQIFCFRHRHFLSFQIAPWQDRGVSTI